jgi:hypothetical protein
MICLTFPVRLLDLVKFELEIQVGLRLVDVVDARGLVRAPDQSGSMYSSTVLPAPAEVLLDCVTCTRAELGVLFQNMTGRF